MPSNIFDDRDSTVTYTGSWIVGGSAHEYQNTVSSTTKAGDRFAFPFTGTSIGVYGTYDASSAGVRTSYAIDGGAATTVTSSASALDSYKQLFWQSDTLSPGQHKLVVTMQSVNPLPGGEGTIWFDYFNVTAAAVIPPSSPSSAASATASDITGGAIPSKTKGTSAGSSNTNTAAKSSNSAAADSKKSHSSAYIAGIVIALVVLVAVAAGLLWRRKRQRNRYYSNFPPVGASPMPSNNGPAPTQPFLHSPSPNSPMTSMSSFPGSPPVMAAYANPSQSTSPGPYAPSGPGGFDSRATYAAPAGAPYSQSGQTGPAHGYDPYAAIGAATMQQSLHNPAPQSSYAPSVSSIPSSSQYGTRAPLSVVGSTADGDSIAELKRRQQQVVNSYEQGIGGSGSHSQAPIIQHVDSGIRTHDEPGPSELPPVYTPN